MHSKISDIHISKFHNENGARFHRYVQQERPLVAPAFTLVTGDIADSHRRSHSIPLHSQQQVDEWQFVNIPHTVCHRSSPL